MEFMSRGSFQGVLLMQMVSETQGRVPGGLRSAHIEGIYFIHLFHTFLDILGACSEIFQWLGVFFQCGSCSDI